MLADKHQQRYHLSLVLNLSRQYFSIKSTLEIVEEAFGE